jgi:catechol 2,3-dioxygenase-like lactoylglutathione lyase family enzyme
MSLALDHIVIAVSDLDATRADYAALGFNPIQGGEHANGITHNVLVILEDGSYLELIAWKRPDSGNRWSDLFHGDGEGLVDHALLPDDIARVVAGAQARGLDIEAPVDGGRHRPDGERLEWKTARSPRPDVPFLCGDVTPRRLRVQEDAEIRRQPNGVTGVAEVTVAVRDAEASAQRYAALLGQDAPPPVEEGEALGTPAMIARLALANGTAIRLAAPLGDGPLTDLLGRRGEGPVAVLFRGGPKRELDLARTHGARMATGG